MSYIDSLMATNEQIVYRTKKHWMAPLLATMTGTILTILGILALGGTIFVEGGMDGVLKWGGLAMLLVGVVLVARSLVIWWSSDYFVTNQKVMKVSGILRKTAGGAGLEKINDVTMSQNILGRTLDFGDLTVLTAADESNLSYTMMRKPAEFRRAMLDQQQFHEQADARFIADAVRQGPSQTPMTQPPMSQGAKTQGSMGQGPMAQSPIPHGAHSAALEEPEPPAKEPPTMPPAKQAASSGDIPELIQRLALLRDQGAISTEEYEAKKAELLGRL